MQLAKYNMPWKEFLLVPISDVQLGSPACDEDRFKKFIEWAEKHDNVRYVLLGDAVDVASPSNRKILSSSDLYDSAKLALDEIAQIHLDRFLKLVRGIEGRVLGCLRGHHFHSFQDGSSSDTRIADALGAPFLGDSAFVSLNFTLNDNRANHKSASLTIVARHGEGGGGKVASPLNKLENTLPYYDADIHLIAHMHKVVSAPIDQLYVRGDRILSRRRVIACTGSFLKSYVQDHLVDGLPGGTYSEKGMMNPVALGGVAIKVTPQRVTRGELSTVEFDYEIIQK